MTIVPVQTFTLNPGGSFFYPAVIAPTRRLFAEITSVAPGPGTPLLYLDVIVGENISPIGSVFARVKTLLINDVGAAVISVPESTAAGGWFARFYCINRRNGGAVTARIYLQQPFP